VLVSFVTAAVTAGGTVTAAVIINADRLQGYAANQLVRVASLRTPVFVTPPWETANLGSATIVAPRDGMLVMMASSQIDDEGPEAGPIRCWLKLDGTKIPVSERHIGVSQSSSFHEQTCTTLVAWPVTAGTHRVVLVARNPENLLGIYMGPTTITVLFEPFTENGTVPSVAPS
jgi:hypothetical protein